ncbi:MAG: cytochrome c oxidase assembly protein [Acidobacteriota bacterium]|nr:cytochrome c oxidase assembly protein [Acidobacteriota bacterium]
MPGTLNPTFSLHHLNQWRFAWVPTVLLVAFAAAYLYAQRGRDWPRSRTFCFLGGLLVTFLAVESVVAVFDRTYFADHMIQHLLLIMVAAPLFALSAPLELTYQVLNERGRAVLDGRVARALTHPVVAFGLYAVFIPLTHLTSLFNLMLTHEAIHDVEHLGFLVVGYLFFRVAFGRERGVALHPGLRLVFVMVAVPVDTFTGLALAMTSKNPFPAYRHLAPRGATATSILNDVHLGGAIMWIGGDALMLLACVPIAVIWTRYETQRTRALDAELDAQGL